MSGSRLTPVLWTVAGVSAAVVLMGVVLLLARDRRAASPPLERPAAPSGAGPVEGPPGHEPVAGREDLERLAQTAQPKYRNDDILQYMTAVFAAYEHPDRPAADAPPAEKAEAEKDVAEFRREVEDGILKLLVLTKVEDGRNLREDVNLRAAQMLGEMADGLDAPGRAALSARIRRAVEHDFLRSRVPVGADVLEAAFAALGRLGDPTSLEWMLGNFCLAKEHDTSYLAAAHRAMVQFRGVPGDLRRAIVQQFVRLYVGVEVQGIVSGTDPQVRSDRFWRFLRPGVLAVVQHFAEDAEGRPPADAEGRPLETVAAFQDWLRTHDDPSRAPWTDP